MVRERPHVTEVTPSGVRHASLDSGDDFLGVDHVQRIPGHHNGLTTPKPRNRDDDRLGPDRVTHVYIEMKAGECACYPRVNSDADAGVFIFFTNDLGGGRGRVEVDAVVGGQSDGEYGADHVKDNLCFVAETQTREIDIAGWTPITECREEHAAPKDEFLPRWTHYQTSKESIQYVQLDQLVRGST